MATNAPQNLNKSDEKFQWTDALLELAFGKGKFVENKHGVIVYSVGKNTYVVDESANIYYGEISNVYFFGGADQVCSLHSQEGCIEMEWASSGHKLTFTIGKGTKLQKVEDHFQQKRDKINAIQKQEAIRNLLSDIISGGVVIPSSANNMEVDGEEMKYIQQIYDMEVEVGGTKTTIRGLFNEIEKEENILALRQTITFLKKTEPFNHFPGIFEYFEVIIQDKVNKIELDRGYLRIGEIVTLLADANVDISILFSLKIELERWLEARAKNPLPTGTKERDATKMLEDIKIRIDKQKVAQKDTILQNLSVYEQEVQTYLENILYIEHIQGVYNLDIYTRMGNLIAILPEENAREKRARLAKIINDRRTILERDKEMRAKELSEKRISLLRDIRTNMSELRDIVQALENDGDILSCKRENGLVKTTNDLIWQLGAEEAEKLHAELMNMFDERMASLKLTESIFHKTGGKIDLGNNSHASVFEPEKTIEVVWKIVGKKSGDEIVISFENNIGGKIEPSIQKQYRKSHPLAVKKSDFSELQDYVMRWNTRYKAAYFHALSEYKKAEVEYNLSSDNAAKKEILEEAKISYQSLEEKSYLARMFQLLPKHNLSSRPGVPSLYAGTVIGPTTEVFLQNFADLAEKQVESQGKGSGIIIIEGDAGTGKNFKIDIYAHMTNREVFEMQGNKTAQKEDILYSYELNQDGTYRLPSQLIRGIQTPGALIMLDEVNTYPPEVLKLLNPLLDGRRYINDPQFGKVKVHPSVLIVGLMNPQHYLGTTPLSPEIKSRARMMKDTYPAEKIKEGIVSWEEAYLITRHMTRYAFMGKMDQNTFISYWNTLVNNINTGADTSSKELTNILGDISRYISLVNSMRRIYQNTMIQKGNEEFSYPISLRDGIQIIEEYERNGLNMGGAILDVILPKISGKNVDVGAESKVLQDRVAKLF